MAGEKETERKIQEIVHRIVQEYQPEKIILFGSWAWGTPGQDSDIDLFIVKESAKSRIERQRELRRLLLDSGFPPLDLLVYTPEEVQRKLSMKDFFIQDITQKGKTLYAR